MAEFSTTGTLDLEVSPDSIRGVEKQIEKRVEPTVTVSTATSGGGGSGGGRGSQINRHWRDNLDLNRDRNDLLRQLVDVNEKDAQTSRGRGLGGGALGLAIGGIGLGSMLLSNLGSKIGDAIPDLSPSDVINSVPIGVPDVIDSVAQVNAADVIGSLAEVGASSVVDTLAEVGASDVVAEAATISPGDVIDAAVEVDAADLVKAAATVTTGALVSSLAAVNATDLVDTAAEIGPADVIDAAVELVPDDIVSGTISAEDIVNRLVDPAELPDGAGVAAGGAAGAGAGAAAAAKRYGLGNLARGGASKAAGVASPVFTREMVGLGPNEVPDPKNGGTRKTDLKSNEEWIRDALSGPADPDAGPEITPGEYKTSPTGTRGPNLGDLEGVDSQQEVSVTQDNTFEINADTSDLERKASEKFSEVDRRLSELERAFDG